MKSEVSALMDGALEERAINSTLDAMGKNPELRRDWGTWHLIGDTLRHGSEGAESSPVLSVDFTSRFMQALEDEPTVLAPQPLKPKDEMSPRFRHLMPLAASVMGIGAVVWVAQTLGLGVTPPAAAVAVVAAPHVLAAASKPVQVPVQVPVPELASADSAPPPGMAQAVQPVALIQSSGQMREYVVAHEGYSAGAVMQGLARYQRGMAEGRQGSGQ